MSSNDQWRCWIGVGHAAAHALHARTRSARNYATQAVTKVGVLSRKDAFSEPGPVAFSSPVPVAVVSSIVRVHPEGLDLSIESFDGSLISSQIASSTVAMMLPVSLTHPHASFLLHEKKEMASSGNYDDTLSSLYVLLHRKKVLVLVLPSQSLDLLDSYNQVGNMVRPPGHFVTTHTA